MSSSDKTLKSYRLDSDTIDKITEIKYQISKVTKKYISYSDIVISAFNFANTEDLVDFITKEQELG